MKLCTKCDVEKPLTDYYPDSDAKDGRRSACRRCMNAAQATGSKVVRNRARHRAIAELVKRHEDEFSDLLSLYLHEAAQEAQALAQTPEAAAHYSSTPVRLRPGARQPGQKPGDRIDVARCPHCVKHHDRGHVCPSCGAVPHTTVAVPDDGEVDEIAVERAMKGDPTALTTRERDEAFLRLATKGLSDDQIAHRLNVSSRTVLRWRQAQGLESRWTA